MPNPEIYAALIDQLSLFPEHREHLQNARGFTDEIIDQLRFVSCGEHVAAVLRSLLEEFSAEDLREAGLWTDGPNRKLLANNILIPYLDWQSGKMPRSVVNVRPHKDFLAGLTLYPYLPGKVANFAILAESEYKAAACQQWGFPAVGIPGISSFSGKHFATLMELFQKAGTTTVCVIFDNEIKNNPDFRNFKQDFRVRWDTQFYAYWMASELKANGLQATIAVLPDAWRVDGKIDLDGALAQGRTRIEIESVLRARVEPGDYFRSLPEEARMVIKWKEKIRRLKLPINKVFNKYFIRKMVKDIEVDVPVSNFGFDIQNNFIAPDGTCSREVIFTDEDGHKSARYRLEGEHLADLRRFKGRVTSLGPYLFTGTPRDLDAVVAYESAHDIGRRIIQPDRVGWIDGLGWLFLNGLLRPNGEIVWADRQGIIWQGMNGHEAFPLAKEGAEMPRLSQMETDPAALLDDITANFGGDYSVRLAGAWIYTSFFSHWLAGIFPTCFPLLWISGQRSSGKSTLGGWLLAMAGLRAAGKNYHTTTTVAISRSVGYYSSLPYCLEEFRNSPQGRDREKEGLLRSIYDRQLAQKGLRTNFGIRGGLVRGTLMVEGQDTPIDAALQSRCITIRLREGQIEGSFYESLNDRIELFSGVLPVLAKRWNRKAVAEAIETMRKRLVGAGLDNRTAITYALPVGFYDQMVQEHHGDFVDFACRHAIVSHEAKKEEEPTNRFLVGLVDLKSAQLLSNCVRATRENQLAIHFSMAFHEWEAQMRRSGQEFGFKKETLLDAFEETPYFIERARSVRMGKYTPKCLILDPTKNDVVKDLFKNADQILFDEEE